MFVVREKIGTHNVSQQKIESHLFLEQKTKESTTYVDVKSEFLRDILGKVLKNVRSVNVKEAQPSVSNLVT